MIHWLKKCSPPPEDLITLWEDYCFIIEFDLALSQRHLIPAHLSDAACHTILSQSPGLFRILQAWWVCHTAIPLMPPLQMDGLLYIRFLLHIPWDELWAILRASHSLMGGRSIEKLSILLIFTLRSTTISPEIYPWPLTCRDLARGCIRLLLDQDGPPIDRAVIFWAPLVRLSPPCDDLLADIRNFSPSLKMDAVDILHNVLEWLKTFPQPPFDVIDRLQGYLDEHHQCFHPGISYCPTFKECEERWTEFREQMASWQQETQ
ncbi:hypothetical protein FB451DRAFT_722604 [Mycena latifolia]|nr:hypothetical protein FB451DRAFT_722604 [Mycena latifolia]